MDSAVDFCVNARQSFVDAEVNESGADSAACAVRRRARCWLVRCGVGAALGRAEGNALPVTFAVEL
jgi:hypothetical protein